MKPTSYRRLAPIALLVFCLALLVPTAAHADGSRELHSTGPGQRGFLEYQSGTTIGIPRRNTIFAFTKAGERVHFGSSNMRFGTTNNINYVRGDGTTGTCAPNALGTGLIASYGQEQIGPAALALGGYASCFEDVTATTQGVWQFTFLATGGNPATLPYNGTAVTGLFPTATTAVAAWDVTVATGSGLGAVAVPGRVWTRYLPLNMGSNSVRFYGELYVTTYDGYLYRVGFNGLDPFGFVLFSNNRGFYSSTSTVPGSRYYRSVNLSASDTLVAPDTVHLPTNADTTDNKTNYLFFNTPNTDALAVLGIASTPQGTNLGGIHYIPNSGTAGGRFTFTCDRVGNYYIALITNPTLDPDRVILSGSCAVGTNSALWNGQDAFGQVVPNNGCGVDVEAYAVGGEVHFPLIDAERSLSGLMFARLNGTGATPANPNRIIYWNDTNVQPSAVPIEGLEGVNSATGAHRWGTTTILEDHKGADTWALAQTGNISTNTDLCALAVELGLFEAEARPADIAVRWETESELNNLGFNLWRGTASDAPTEQLNSDLIPATSPGSGQGNAYEWLDTNVSAGTTYYYWLEDVEASGATRWHGPVNATFASPTAIQMSQLQSTSATPDVLSLMVGFGVVIGLLAVARRLRR